MTSLHILKFIIEINYRESLPSITETQTISYYLYIYFYLIICVSVASYFEKMKLNKTYLNFTILKKEAIIIWQVWAYNQLKELTKHKNLDDLVQELEERLAETF